MICMFITKQLSSQILSVQKLIIKKSLKTGMIAKSYSWIIKLWKSNIITFKIITLFVLNEYN
jgi:hypothetical protein